MRRGHFIDRDSYVSGGVLQGSQGRRHVSNPSSVPFPVQTCMAKDLGVKTERGKAGEVPVYDPATFETNVPGVYVAGHFTHQRHIKGAIDAAKGLVPAIKKKLSSKTKKARN